MKKIAILTTTLAEEDFYLYHYQEKEAVEKKGFSCDLLKNGNFEIFYTDGNYNLFYEQKEFNISEYGFLLNQMSLSLGHTADYYVVHCFMEHNIPSYNQIESILQAKNKLHTIFLLNQQKIPVPKTCIIRQKEDISFALSQIGEPPYILKEVYGSGGSKVLLAESKKAVVAIFDYVWVKDRNTIVILQEFIESDKSDCSDVRVLVIDGKVIAAMNRVPSNVDFRANIKLGGKALPISLTNLEKEFCIKSSEALKLKLCGIDFIRTKNGPVFLEVNSNPTLNALPVVAKSEGIDVFDHIADFCKHYCIQQ